MSFDTAGILSLLECEQLSVSVHVTKIMQNFYFRGGDIIILWNSQLIGNDTADVPQCGADDVFGVPQCGASDRNGVPQSGASDT